MLYVSACCAGAEVQGSNPEGTINVSLGRHRTYLLACKENTQTDA